MTTRGIDVSSLQGVIDWRKVAAAGIDFAIIRCVRETGAVDDRFEINVSGAAEAGLIVGAYCFIDDAIEEQQARTFVDAVRAVPFGVMIVGDWERGADNALPTIADFRAWTSIVRNGFPLRPLVVYGSKGVLAVRGDVAGWGPWWRADYGPEPYPEGSWDAVYTARGGDGSPVWTENALGWTRALLWQFSSRGAVPGIGGRVDLNASSLSRAELEVLAGSVVPTSGFDAAIHDAARLTVELRDARALYQAAAAERDAAIVETADLRARLAAAPAIEAERVARSFGEAQANEVRRAAGYNVTLTSPELSRFGR